MKFFLLTDDADAMIGMRLAGIEGKLVKSPESAKEEYEKAKAEGTGILLLTHGTAAMFGASLVEMKYPIQIPNTTLPTRFRTISVTQSV